ncbi:hypothetical protein HK101_005052, partial [Irineochytrium annulatum]
EGDALGEGDGDAGDADGALEGDGDGDGVCEGVADGVSEGVEAGAEGVDGVATGAGVDDEGVTTTTEGGIESVGAEETGKGGGGEMPFTDGSSVVCCTKIVTAMLVVSDDSEGGGVTVGIRVGIVRVRVVERLKEEKDGKRGKETLGWVRLKGLKGSERNCGAGSGSGLGLRLSMAARIMLGFKDNRGLKNFDAAQADTLHKVKAALTDVLDGDELEKALDALSCLDISSTRLDIDEDPGRTSTSAASHPASTPSSGSHTGLGETRSTTSKQAPRRPPRASASTQEPARTPAVTTQSAVTLADGDATAAGGPGPRICHSRNYVDANGVHHVGSGYTQKPGYFVAQGSGIAWDLSKPPPE